MRVDWFCVNRNKSLSLLKALCFVGPTKVEPTNFFQNDFNDKVERFVAMNRSLIHSRVTSIPLLSNSSVRQMIELHMAIKEKLMKIRYKCKINFNLFLFSNWYVICCTHSSLGWIFISSIATIVLAKTIKTSK